MQKLILVNSLSHSGSTVLSMILSGHSKLISLGEIFQVLREPPNYWLRDNEITCSCGASASMCPLWGTALRKIADRADLNDTKNKYERMNDKYQILLDTFESIYDKEKVAVDTSKGFKHLKTITKMLFDIHILFLIRDARAYASSQTRIARAQKRRGYKKIKCSTFYQLLRWYYENRKRQQYIKEEQLNAMQVSYEQLCFQSKPSVVSICNDLGIEYQENMITLSKTKHHILNGNAMRLNQQQRSSITYDYRWLANNDWILPYALLWNVRRYNRNVIFPNNLQIHNPV